MKVRVSCPPNAGQEVHTRWGPVLFDASGVGELEVSGDDALERLRSLKWETEVLEETVTSDTSLTPEEKASAALDGADATSGPVLATETPEPVSETPEPASEKEPHPHKGTHKKKR